MAAAKKAEGGESPGLDLQAKSPTVVVEVAPRRTVHVEGERRHGAGEKVELPVEEADRLFKAGFVLSPGRKARSAKKSCPAVEKPGGGPAITTPEEPGAGEGEEEEEGEGGGD